MSPLVEMSSRNEKLQSVLRTDEIFEQETLLILNITFYFLTVRKHACSTPLIVLFCSDWCQKSVTRFMTYEINIRPRKNFV